VNLDFGLWTPGSGRWSGWSPKFNHLVPGPCCALSRNFVKIRSQLFHLSIGRICRRLTIGWKLGKEWSDFDSQWTRSYFLDSRLQCKVSSKSSENCNCRRVDRQTDWSENIHSFFGGGNNKVRNRNVQICGSLSVKVLQVNILMSSFSAFMRSFSSSFCFWNVLRAASWAVGGACEWAAWLADRTSEKWFDK